MKTKWLIPVGWLLAASVLLAACADARSAPVIEDPAIAAIYADADAKAAQKRAQQLRATATEAANATATALYAPIAAQTQEARTTEEARVSLIATAAPMATAEAAAQAAMAQAATAAPLATATASALQTAAAAPFATQQAQQVFAAQTAVVAPTATWQAFQLEAAKLDALAQAEQQNAAVNRLLDLAWIGALVILVAASIIIVGRQIAQVMTQTTLARATATTRVEQARAATERERQKAEDAKARASLARPPVYVIEEHAPVALARNMPNEIERGDASHGDDDIQYVWEMQLSEPVGSLEQTGSIIIDNEAQVAQSVRR